MPALSVIILSYNSGADRLKKAVDSLERQTFRDFEVILFDNASTDGCTADLPELPHLKRIEHTENLGFAAGINHAVGSCTSEWIVLLNPDAVAAPDWLEKLVATSIGNPDISSFGSVQISADNHTMLDGLGDVFYIAGIAWRGGFDRSIDLRPTENKEIFAPCAAGSMYKKELFVSLKGFEESFFCYHEDVDFGVRLQLQGERTLLVHDAVIYHEGSGTTGRFSDFTIYHGIRNRIWTYIRTMPPILFWMMLPAHFLINILFLIRSIFQGTSRSYYRGMKHGFLKADKAWEDRREIQKKRKVSTFTFMKKCCWSPYKLLRRAPHFPPLSHHL